MVESPKDTQNGLVEDDIAQPINHTVDNDVNNELNGPPNGAGEDNSGDAGETNDSKGDPIPSKEEQLNTVTASSIDRLTVGSTVYLIPTKWHSAFTSWARGTGQEPGPVDPLPVLCDSDGVLLQDAQEGRDWICVNSEGWNLIKRWYSPTIPY
jgi:DUSP domain